jgi:hypothetical protein
LKDAIPLEKAHALFFHVSDKPLGDQEKAGDEMVKKATVGMVMAFMVLGI